MNDGEGAAEHALRTAAGEALGVPARAEAVGAGTLASVYPVDALASASIAVFGDALQALVAGFTRPPQPARVDRGLASAWFRQALHPVGWTLPSPWDPVAGDYRAADGWIRLHTNAPHHRAAALGVLGVAGERDAVAAAVATWHADDLEAAVVAAGGCAAAMRSARDWATHPQGIAVAAEPLVAIERTAAGDRDSWRPTPERPLAGLRVLDLTRVLAGPVASRALAAYGATVLRIDPPDWDEPAIVPEMTLGKRAARLDARSDAGRARLHQLLAGADVLVHGYRAGALDHLRLDAAARQRIRPGLVDVALTAYGSTGPWTGRRGFDSLVQMSTGIAESGMRAADAAKPVPLPVQALDHATGWLMAAAVVEGLRRRLDDRRGFTARLSLARTAAELEAARASGPGLSAAPLDTAPASTRLDTPWGPADLLAPPLRIAEVPFRFDVGPIPLGADEPTWP